MPKASENPSSASALRWRLKQHTAAAHQALQDSPVMGRLLVADLTWPQYRDLLGRYYGFLEPLHRNLQHQATGSLWAGFVDPALRLAELRRDVQTAVIDPDALPRADPGWLQPGSAFTAGVIYVLLGSTLGGKLIARALALSLGLTADHGCAYFTAHDAAGSWPHFLEELERYPWTGADLEALQSAALHTFEQLHRWVEPTSDD